MVDILSASEIYRNISIQIVQCAIFQIQCLRVKGHCPANRKTLYIDTVSRRRWNTACWWWPNTDSTKWLRSTAPAVILSKFNKLTFLLVDLAHRNTTYAALYARNLVRKLIWQWVICIRYYRANTRSKLMSNLPIRGIFRRVHFSTLRWITPDRV